MGEPLQQVVESTVLAPGEWLILHFKDYRGDPGAVMDALPDELRGRTVVVEGGTVHTLKPQVGTCEESAPGLLDGPRLHCVLPSGHDGCHCDRSGAEWTDRGCETKGCVLAYGHSGLHCDSDGAERGADL